MTLYKFKSLDNFEFVADIIMNNRLYSALFTDLNDPMEGIFEYDNGVDDRIINQIINEKENHRVCALTKSYHNPILWAHYADSFKGICIEVEIDENILDTYDINYGPFTPIVLNEYDMVINFPQEPVEWAKSALTRKYEDWAYEEEVRLLNTHESGLITEGIDVKSIIFGTRTTQTYKNVLRKIAPSNIDFFDSKISNVNQVETIELVD